MTKSLVVELREASPFSDLGEGVEVLSPVLPSVASCEAKFF